MAKPTDLPSQAEFGQFVAKCVTKLGMTGKQARDAFGSAPGGRDWKTISDDAKAVMKQYPKA